MLFDLSDNGSLDTKDIYLQQELALAVAPSWAAPARAPGMLPGPPLSASLGKTPIRANHLSLGLCDAYNTLRYTVHTQTKLCSESRKTPWFSNAKKTKFEPHN